MTDRVLVLGLAVAIATVLGLLSRWRDRRVERRGFATATAAAVTPRVIDLPAAASGAAVVLSTRACATCARTQALLERAASGTDVHVAHVLLEDRPDLMASLDVRTAPTVLLLDATGAVVGRHDGGLDVAGARSAVASLVPAGAR